jgi:hypothetical protein
MTRPQVADGGEGLQILRIAANILNKQSREVDKDWSSSMGVGRVANNPHRNSNVLRNASKRLVPGLSKYDLPLVIKIMLSGYSKTQ